MLTKEEELKRKTDIRQWIISARTVPFEYPITGVSFSPLKRECIVLYTKIPAEVEAFPMPKRQRVLDLLGVDEPKENAEDDLPIIIMNKTYLAQAYGMGAMRAMNKFSFYRNFKRTALANGVDITNPRSAYHLIGKKLVTPFIQMRKANTDVRIWSPDRVGMQLKNG